MALVVSLGLQAFYRSTFTAEYIQRVADGATQREHLEDAA